MATVEADNIFKSFGGNLVLDDVTMQAETGSVTGLIGPNGAGKSTLLNIISGFLKTDSGHILMNGKDVTGKPPHR